MKKLLSIITLSILSLTHVNANEVKTIGKNNQPILVKSTAELKVYDGVLDLVTAGAMGDWKYIESKTKVDPDLVKRFNDSGLEEYIGFDSFDSETFKYILNKDPELTSRLGNNQRNILSNTLFNYYEKLSPKDIEYFKKYEQEFIKMGITPNPKFNIIKKDKTIYNEKLISYLDAMPTQILNGGDTYQNTSLHYAVARKKVDLVQKILSNSKFYSKNALNKYKENALFMLIDDGCTIAPEEDVKIMKILLDTKMNLLQRNYKGASFPVIVMSSPRYQHLQKALTPYLSSGQKLFFDKDLASFKVKRPDYVKFLESSTYWAVQCNEYESKESKVKLN